MMKCFVFVMYICSLKSLELTYLLMCITVRKGEGREGRVEEERRKVININLIEGCTLISSRKLISSNPIYNYLFLVFD